MIELQLLTQAAASAASNYPLMFDLAQIGFEAVRNAREQRTLGELEIERAALRYGPALTSRHFITSSWKVGGRTSGNGTLAMEKM